MPSELLLIPTDVTLIIRRISNILGNAIKYTSEEENITIKFWDTRRMPLFVYPMKVYLYNYVDLWKDYLFIL